MENQATETIQAEFFQDEPVVIACLGPEHTRLLHLFDRLPVQDRLEMVLLARLKMQLRAWEPDDEDTPRDTFG